MEKHTPGKLDYQQNDDDGFNLESQDGTVCTLEPRNLKLTVKRQAANAARLALCWNCHDALVAFTSKSAAWLERRMEQAEAQAQRQRDRLPALAEAAAFDAKNYRIQLAEARAALKAAGVKP